MIEQLNATLATYKARCQQVTRRMVQDANAGRGYARDDLARGERYARLIIHTEAQLAALQA